jgi:hypothetical protein
MVIAGAPVFVKVAEPLIPAVVIVCGPDPDDGTVKIPTVDGGVGQVFAAHAVPERAEPSKLMAPELAGVARNPVRATVVPCAPEIGEMTKKLPDEVIVRRTVTELDPSVMVIE